MNYPYCDEDDNLSKLVANTCLLVQSSQIYVQSILSVKIPKLEVYSMMLYNDIRRLRGVMLSNAYEAAFIVAQTPEGGYIER